MPPQFTAAEVLTFFDYEHGMPLILNQGLAITARRDAHAYPGVVEAGQEVAMRLLRNHVC